MHEQLKRNLTIEDMHIAQVFDYYQTCYLHSARCKKWILQSKRVPEALRQQKLIGLCDRTLGKHIPSSRTYIGGSTRGILRQCGLLTSTGGELFRGCVVFATVEENGRVGSAIGIRFGKRLRRYDKLVIEWKRPNLAAQKHDAVSRAKEVYCV